MGWPRTLRRLLSRCRDPAADGSNLPGCVAARSKPQCGRRFLPTAGKSVSDDGTIQDGSGKGSTSGSVTTVTTETLNLRYDHALDLAPRWILALRSDLPLLAKNPITSSNPDGDYLHGIGDADVQAIVIHNLSQRWAVGFGARLIAPTGGDALGSGKWQIMPIIGARYGLWEINSSSYFEPVVRYDTSFAGDPTRRNISNLQFAPTFNLGLPDRWFITFYPSADIRINLGDPITSQTGRLFLPFDARIGRKLSDNCALSFELGVPIIKDYPVYNLKTQIRLNVTY
jgi:hypothetical protein